MTETVDKSGTLSSLAVDRQGNLHIGYLSARDGVKYGFRQVGSSRWFTMSLGKPADGYVQLTLDHQGNPSICFTGYEMLTYAHFENKHWTIQQVAPNSGLISYSCSVAVGTDGVAHLAWYQYYDRDRSSYLHLKYAALRDGAWLARTLDFDNETGKWNFMVLDAQGNPHISYSSYAKGELKYAYWNGSQWSIRVVDSRNSEAGRYNLGMGNSVFLDQQGKTHFSYYVERDLVYARPQKDRWVLEVIDTVAPPGRWDGFRSTLILDKNGFAHIAYEDGRALKHAYWNGKQWRIQVIAPPGAESLQFSSITIDEDNVLYISYRDPEDGSLKVAIGRWVEQPQGSGLEKEDPS